MSPNREADNQENWERQVKKGWLDLAILSSLWQEKLYGLDILRRLEEQSDLILAEGTIYPILNRRKADGLGESKWVESETGHPRKSYWLTPAGRRAATAMARYASGFLSQIQRLIAPLLKEEEQ